MEKNTISGNWINEIGGSQPLLISGPCSAETQQQVLTIAHQLKKTNTTVLRAGIWKPRTRPGNFEGVGEMGLKWLQQAKKETGLLTATEVANPNHVALALQYDVDILWIGARTTVSPFSVQEIAQALRGVSKIVLVKNPVNPDLALWIGAIERIYEAGIKNIGAIHRGFSTYEKSPYRNNPQWQIPIDLKQKFPNIPLLIDPSHIGGQRDLIFDLCQTALDLNYDGFMIESHHQPDDAWSDAKQQITPEQLSNIMNQLVVREKNATKDDYLNTLQILRSKIDQTDTQLLQLLGSRMQIAKEIGKLKKDNNVAILQSTRWDQILKTMIHLGKQNNLSESFVTNLFKAIHQESIAQQEKVINNN